jgi:hypothetical protein
VLAGLRSQLAEVRREFAAPLPGEATLSRSARFRARSRRIATRYGWRFVVTAVVFYLVRDLVLYVILPYLAVRSFAG